MQFTGIWECKVKIDEDVEIVNELDIHSKIERIEIFVERKVIVEHPECSSIKQSSIGSSENNGDCVSE